MCFGFIYLPTCAHEEWGKKPFLEDGLYLYTDATKGRMWGKLLAFGLVPVFLVSNKAFLLKVGLVMENKTCSEQNA